MIVVMYALEIFHGKIILADFYKANPEEYHNMVRELVKEFHKP